MLSREDNELLTRVGPCTPMGDLMRHYWLPVLFSRELPEPDGNPVRVRLLGEDLIAFRSTSGQVGLVGNHCPHRGASLYFGRNEENGLRCVYHGWKFDVSGRCVDMPNEPPESNFKEKVRQTAYPCVEAGGAVWTYMGPEQSPPPLPALEWNLVPESHVYVSKRLQETSYMQGLEGDIDSSHVSFLHGTLHEDEFRHFAASLAVRAQQYFRQDKHPRFEVVDTDYGVVIGAQRTAEAGHSYWRLTQFLMPVYTMIPPFGEEPAINGKAWVPMDDEHLMNWTWTWHPTRPLNETELAALRSGETAHVGEGWYQAATTAAGSGWRPRANQANDYLIDWEAQRTRSYSGLPGNWGQDMAMQEGMGPIYDRSGEHLGSSDTAVIRVRRRLIQAARALRELGAEPPAAASPDLYRVRSTSVVLPNDVSWLEGARDRLLAHPGRYYAQV